ncbi:MAG: WG repeat-containing protein, partial [Bacteroidia bacterium]|nr:WG repeat-containing protein [Bacteroidia bacterium]
MIEYNVIIRILKRMSALLIISLIAWTSFAQNTNDGKVVYKVGDFIPTYAENGLWGYQQYGEYIIPPRFSVAGPFCEGIAAVAMNGKYGYIDRQGKSVIPYKYDSANNFSEGLAAVCMNGKYGYIDNTGKSVIPFRFEAASDFRNGLATVSLAGVDKYVDTAGKIYDNKEDVLKTYSSFAKQYVEQYVNQWQKKGKYEKTESWKKRVNIETRRVLIDSLLKSAKREYIAYQSRSVKTDQSIVEYDADGEIFLIHDKQFGSLLVPVPISQAESFEKGFADVSRSNTYCVSDDRLGLESAVFTTPDGRSFTYRNNNSLEFASVDISYNFDSINVDADDADDGNVGKSRLLRKSVVTGKSDVDTNIPSSRIVNDKTFAVIIANEKYQSVTEVDCAENDGDIFREYCHKTLGVPEKNIHFVPNATLVNMWAQVDWLESIAKAYNGDASLIFYYAGHGIPDEGTRDAYLLPVDGSGSNVKTGYKLSELYSNLSKFPTKQTVVLLDACFSGAERTGDMLVAARGVAL